MRCLRLLLLLLASPALLPAQSWPTTQWQAHCDIGLSVGPCSDTAAEPGVISAVEQELTAASQWLASLGFRPPVVPRTADDAYQAVFANSGFADNDLAIYRQERSADGGTLVSSRLMLRLMPFSDPAFFKDGKVSDGGKGLEANLELFATPIHELFHGVQAAYGLRLAAVNAWIVEGTSEALMHAWMARNGRPYALREPEPYDVSLWKSEDGGYNREHFWWHLGEDLQARDRVSYLAGFLTQPVEANGIPWLDGALGSRGGLYKYFPEFIARHANDTSLYSRQRVANLSLAQRSQVDFGTVLPVAANVVRVEVTLPANREAGLEIRLTEDHPDLHLVVDGEVYDTATRTAPRNTFRMALTGTGNPEKLLVRLVNVAPVAERTESRNYELHFTLRGIDPCSYEEMATALSTTFPLIGGVQPAEYDPDGSMRPTQSTLSISGLVTDQGDTCTMGLAEAGLMSGLYGGGQDIGAVLQGRLGEAERQMGTTDPSRLAARVRDGSLTPRERDQAMAAALSAAGAFDAPDGEGKAVIHVLTPHLTTWQMGFLTHPFATEHTGLAGWRQNAAAHLYITLPEVAPRELKAGERYRAVAVAPGEEDEAIALPGVPTSIAFYTAWRGDFADVPFPPARTAEEARQHEASRAMCLQVREQYASVMREMRSEGMVIPTVPFPGSCDHDGQAFEGEMHQLSGQLEGTLVVDAVTGGVVTGSFDLRGSGVLTTTRSRFTRAGQRLTGDTEEVTEQAGPVRMAGTFAARADVAGNPLGVWARTVRLDNRGRRP